MRASFSLHRSPEFTTQTTGRDRVITRNAAPPPGDPHDPPPTPPQGGFPFSKRRRDAFSERTPSRSVDRWLSSWRLASLNFAGRESWDTHVPYTADGETVIS